MIFYSKVQRAAAVQYLARLGTPRSSHVCVDDVAQLHGIKDQFWLTIDDPDACRIPSEILSYVHHRTDRWTTIVLSKNRPELRDAGAIRA